MTLLALVQSTCCTAHGVLFKLRKKTAGPIGLGESLPRFLATWLREERGGEAASLLWLPPPLPPPQPPKRGLNRVLKRKFLGICNAAPGEEEAEAKRRMAAQGWNLGKSFPFSEKGSPAIPKENRCTKEAAAQLDFILYGAIPPLPLSHFRPSKREIDS